MKCVDLEALLCDYVDGTLTQAERATVELHLAHCAACRQLAADAAEAVSFIERAADVEPPPALVNKILFDARQMGLAAAPRGARRGFARLFEPLLQPRFAMGMAMTILSFSMLGRFSGIQVRQLRAGDLEPAKVWATLEDKAHRAWERSKKYYESLRVVYEIQQTLNDWSQPPEEAAPANSASPANSGALEGPIPARPRGETPPVPEEEIERVAP
ncbi:MAG: zf-HC2 domain-containing protein [Bryobacteraceae bacterium]|nr:zf-HC2 domain-containing protein [Solibacteraceae bacterium]MCO5350549.1 zf-HC2 domain-containing protein [Bryobacteraceae bacterium]